MEISLQTHEAVEYLDSIRVLPSPEQTVLLREKIKKMRQKYREIPDILIEHLATVSGKWGHKKWLKHHEKIVKRRIARGRFKPKKKPIVPVLHDLRGFYTSAEWSYARYDALKRYGGQCACCGASAKTGATMHVDHIKPLRDFWHLRLDLNNLQVLCNMCNRGKGRRHQDDWRG